MPISILGLKNAGTPGRGTVRLTSSLRPASKTGIGDDLRDRGFLFVCQRQQRQARATGVPTKLPHGLFDGRLIGSGLEATIEGEDVTAREHPMRCRHSELCPSGRGSKVTGMRLPPRYPSATARYSPA